MTPVPPAHAAGDRASGAPEPPPSRASSSVELLARARGGDGAAQESLYRRYLGPLKRWSRGRLPHWARDLLDTDDIVQETMLRTLRGADAFDPRHSGAFAGYMRRILANRIRDELRRVGRRPARDGTVGGAVDPAPSPLEEAIGHDVATRYERALASLREQDREAVMARVELGFSFEQIAETVGKPSPDAARMAVSRALLLIAKEMAGGRH